MRSHSPAIESFAARRRDLDEAACLNPKCSNLCSYPISARGRRPLFCSPRCVTYYSAQRKLFLDDLALIDAELAEVPPRSKVATALKQHRAKVSWHLARYGGEPERQS